MTTNQRAPTEAPSRSTFEQIVEALATGLGDGVGWLAERGVLFAVFAVLWLGIGAMFAFSPAAIDELWLTIGTLPFVVQIVLWVLFLPVMAGLWAWEQTWPELVRLAIVLALAAWTFLIFRPNWLRLPGPGDRPSGQSR